MSPALWPPPPVALLATTDGSTDDDAHEQVARRLAPVAMVVAPADALALPAVLLHNPRAERRAPVSAALVPRGDVRMGP